VLAGGLWLTLCDQNQLENCASARVSDPTTQRSAPI
jgi:hypothetical protein